MQERWNADMKVVIVGGVAGGATAAARIRRLNEQAEIVVFERSGYISYANCGLPYYIGDVITDPEALTLQTPESFFSRFRVNMKVRHEVTAIHPEEKTVSVKNLETGEEFKERYDKLLLSPGAKPTQPRLPGVGLDKLFWTLDNGDIHTQLSQVFCQLQTDKASACQNGRFGVIGSDKFFNAEGVLHSAQGEELIKPHTG